MPDYEELYYTLFRATEQAISALIEAQRICEELYLRTPDLPCQLIALPPRETPE